MIIEEVNLSANKNLSDLERLFSRAGKYIDQGYKLKEVVADDGIRCTLFVNPPNENKFPIGFRLSQESDKNEVMSNDKDR